VYGVRPWRRAWRSKSYTQISTEPSKPPPRSRRGLTLALVPFLFGQVTISPTSLFGQVTISFTSMFGQMTISPRVCLVR